ncbi:hypothetical protein HYT58_01725 [Candidatus Woesearchaeota archaeon]|nr:hypothetical protein [Candidatus Woesearchaeota archaeon]
MVKSLSMTPSVVDCQDTSVQAAVDILNLGRSDEDDVAVEVSSRALNYRKRISNIELDENDGDIEVFDVTFPKNLAAGVYALEVQTYYDGSHLSNTEVAQFESVCGKLSEQPTTGTATKAALTLSQSAVSLKRSGVASVGLQVTNTDTATKQFTVRINGAEDFSESFSPKTLTLGPGQSSNVFFNLKGKSDADEGTYTAQVVVESGSQVVDAETLTVRVEGQASSTTGAATALSGLGGLSSTTLWVIGDIVLIGLAIAFIWMIFGGKKRPTVI